MQRQPGCWLGSSHSFKECVTAHWSSDRASIINGHQVIHRSYGLVIVVGEHSVCDEGMTASCAGADRKANVGMSNDKAGEKPAHRKTKVSCINVNRIRVSRYLTQQAKALADGKRVNIPVPALLAKQ